MEPVGQAPTGRAQLTDSSEAMLTVEVRSGEIVAANDTAAELLALAPESLPGTSLMALLDCEPAPRNALRQALVAAIHTVLPPFVLRRHDGSELSVGAMLLPRGGDRVRVVLWPLLRRNPFAEDNSPGQADVVAVLGLDRFRYDEHWEFFEASVTMQEIRARLAELLRSQDAVGPAAATGVVFVLRAVGPEEARDISRALLSHLHRAFSGSSGAVPGARFCVGLARYSEAGAAQATLLAAHNALAIAQYEGAGETAVRFATESDYAFLAARALNQQGALSPAVSTVDDAVAVREPDDPDTAPSEPPPAPEIAPIERGIEGYVVDNMEGAVDQAMFMAGLDVPVAIIGPAGTGKMYVARIIHEQAGGSGDALVQIDCREFRSRSSANSAIARELRRGAGKTLVFKSPHLMNADAQLRLARQLMTRTRVDVSPPEYLPPMKLIALFPEPLEALLRKGELTEGLASAFAAFPIRVPSIKDRKQAVLRWAHKILGQEGDARARDMKGFTPDAERVMQSYEWPGNISEMRQVISDAMDKTDKDWLTPVDLGLFRGISADGVAGNTESKAFLSLIQESEGDADGYIPTTLESLDAALGEAVLSVVESGSLVPLGTWLDDELVLAALDRYRGSLPKSAAFLHTRPRNISRWLPRIEGREEERTGSSLWQAPRRLLHEWIRESSRLPHSPMAMLQDKLMSHVNDQGRQLSTARRAVIMGVSTPTFLKRVRESAQGE